MVRLAGSSRIPAELLNAIASKSSDPDTQKSLRILLERDRAGKPLSGSPRPARFAGHDHLRALPLRHLPCRNR
jgi:hypothetical protein